MGLDMDLQSIQEVRDLIRDAKKAQEVLELSVSRGLTRLSKPSQKPVRPMRSGWPKWQSRRPDLAFGRTRC